MKRASGLKDILWVVATFGAVAIIARLLGGLGATTDLSDSMPWGLWKILNMVAGVALATGGFALAATVHVFGLKKYKSVLKPAILIAFLGYGSSCFALFLDIGLPHRIWKPIFYWNHHSFLFEVAWCVMLYFSITALETAPIVLERFGLSKLVGLLHKVTMPIVIVGITLSTLHHTSLGSLFLVMPARLHELWFTNWLPVLFILSAVGAGIQTVILVTLGYSSLYGKKVDMSVLTGLAKAAAVILALFFVAKIADLAWRGQFAALVSGEWEAGFFIAELLLAAVIPVALIATPSLRERPAGLALAASSAIAGLLLNRLNVGVIGLLRTADATYFPTLAELSLSLGIIAMASLVFIYMVEYFPVFDDAPAVDPSEACERATTAWGIGLMDAPARVSLVVVIALPIAVGMFSANAFDGIALVRSQVSPPLAADATRATLKINGDRDDVGVAFPHDAHKERLGDDASCAKCHHFDAPGDKSSACYLCHTDMSREMSIFNHDSHVATLGDKWSCVECHGEGEAKTVENARSCAECHEKDMGMTAKSGHMADSYEDAMHGLCIECHRQEDEKKSEAKMAECAFCHERHASADPTSSRKGTRQ